MRFQLFYLTAFLILSYSCAQEKPSIDTLQTQLKSSEEFSKNFFFNSIRVIPLDTLNGGQIGAIAKVIAYNEQFYVLDAVDRSILVFNKDGEFLKKIKNPGEGPGEINHIYDFTINKYTGNIELMSPKGLVVQYDEKGNYQTVISLKGKLPSINHMQILNEDVVAFYSKHSEFRINYYSRSRDEIFYSNLANEFKNSANMIHLSPFLERNKAIQFIDYYDGKTYNLKIGGLELNRTLKYGRFQLSGISFPTEINTPSRTREYLKNNNLAYPVVNWLEKDSTESFLILVEGIEYQLIHCDKIKNICYTIGDRFNTPFIPFLSLVDGNYLGAVFNSFDLEGFLGEYLDEETLSLLTKKPNGNPFLFFYKPIPFE